MALPPLNFPPLRTPVVDKDGHVTPVWAQWLEILWRKTGGASMTAPLNIEGTAQQAMTVPPTVMTSGAPTAPSQPGTYAFDPDTGETYYNPTGAGGDWLLL